MTNPLVERARALLKRWDKSVNTNTIDCITQMADEIERLETDFARLPRLEKLLKFQGERDHWKARAEKAEARNAKLEAVLDAAQGMLLTCCCRHPCTKDAEVKCDACTLLFTLTALEAP